MIKKRSLRIKIGHAQADIETSAKVLDETKESISQFPTFQAWSSLCQNFGGGFAFFYAPPSYRFFFLRNCCRLFCASNAATSNFCTSCGGTLLKPHELDLWRKTKKKEILMRAELGGMFNSLG
ncbi:MAG: hypothetical protein ACFFCW_21345 [Candidatus Hodarchaeota archaeon]